MPYFPSRFRRARVVPVVAGLALLGAVSPVWASSTGARHGLPGEAAPLIPNNLLVSTSTYATDPDIVSGVTQLPPGCSTVAEAPDPCGTAVANGQYPYVFNNDTIDPSFGVTSPIVLDEITPHGRLVGSIAVPNNTTPSLHNANGQMVTSFSSKSELSLNLSTDGRYVTFMGYNAPVGSADVSNANTPGAVDPTSAVPGSAYRVVAELGVNGRFDFTETNAYSGDNGRAAIAANVNGHEVFYTAGNAGNGANPEPSQIVLGTGAQLVTPSSQPESAQNPGLPTPIGSFNVVDQLGYPTEKVAKDNNFRGIAISNNVLYYTKGSGSNGVDTVYFLDTTGTACPNGVGLPVAGASLPTSVLSYDPNAAPATTKSGVTTDDPGLTPQDMCILKGFPTASAQNATDAYNYPFALWFANPDTLYVADEGSGDNANTTASATSNGLYSAAAASATAGLEKWVFNHSTGSWQLAYTLQNGLNLGQPYSVSGYPIGLNDGASGTGLPWAPATDGLRNMTGRVNPNGTVTIWAATSTVSGSGDQGADPNALVKITDRLGATALPTDESFQTVIAPHDATVIRGVSFTPGSQTGSETCPGQGWHGCSQADSAPPVVLHR